MTEPLVRTEVLDKGFVELLEMFGDELTIVNAARVSFGTQKKTLSMGDKKLLKYLWKNQHWSPFRHLMFRFRIKAPEVVMRQAIKHIVGVETTSTYPTKDSAWNETSLRYRPVKEYYYPEVWRKQSKDNKQGSAGPLNEMDSKEADYTFRTTMEVIISAYENLLAHGVAKEQARILLPLNLYTEVAWACSAQALYHFIQLRDAPDAQWEIREYARVMREMLKEKCPVLYGIWFEE